jgi:hypothetical protein
MQKRFLEIRLHELIELKQEIKSKVISNYKVDLYTLAIGPIHHSIGLQDQSGKYVGKLSCDIIFSQMN